MICFQEEPMYKPLRILLLVENSRIFGRDLLGGIAEYSHLCGPWRFYNELSQEYLSVSTIKKLAPAGIIVQAVYASKVEDFLPKDIPVIVISGAKGIIPGVPNIITDWRATGEMASRHLIERGFRRFAFCGYENCDWSYKRGLAFSESLKNAGLKLNSWLDLSEHYNERNLKRIRGWIEELEKPIALLACHDDRARHVLEACQLDGINVPEQIAILGVDNDPLRCDLADPPLSSIALNCWQAGFKAAKLLHQIITSGQPSQEIIVIQPTHVQTRQSTDILAIDDPEIALALKYIRLNAKKQLTVEDVAEAASMSRRSLERRFQKTVKSSVMKRIRKERVALISNRLVSTNESISKIAMDFSMSSFKYFAAYFKNETGMTPRDYRRKFGQ